MLLGYVELSTSSTLKFRITIGANEYTMTNFSRFRPRPPLVVHALNIPVELSSITETWLHFHIRLQIIAVQTSLNLLYCATKVEYISLQKKKMEYIIFFCAHTSGGLLSQFHILNTKVPDKKKKMKMKTKTKPIGRLNLTRPYSIIQKYPCKLHISRIGEGRERISRILRISVIWFAPHG